MIQISVKQRIHGLRILAVYGNRIYASSGYRVFISTNLGLDFHCRASFYPGCLKNTVDKSRLGQRLTRAGFHDLVELEDGALLAIIDGFIIMCPRDDSIFIPVFKIERGSRPLGLAYYKGRAYFGEYFDNPDRDKLFIYRSEDGGAHWTEGYVYPEHTIRHIHRIIPDVYRDGLIILTGDGDTESKIMITCDDFRTVKTLLEGGQYARAVSVIPQSGGLIFATDAPDADNYIQFLDMDGHLHRLHSLPSSSFHSCTVDQSMMFISTVAEPSKVNEVKKVFLYGSEDGVNWNEYFACHKDIWPMKLFQYGTIVFPNGINNTGHLFFSTIGLRNNDNYLHIWRLTK